MENTLISPRQEDKTGQLFVPASEEEPNEDVYPHSFDSGLPTCRPSGTDMDNIAVRCEDAIELLLGFRITRKVDRSTREKGGVKA